MGLTNAPSSFQRIMTNVLSDLTRTCVKVYLDDIIIHSRTKEEHMEHLRLVLARLREYRMYIKLRKCKFLQHRVTFLGHDIDANGVHIAHDKVLAVEQWPVPQNAADVRSFLGFVQFFRRSLRGLAGVSLPLTKLTSKETPWRWGSAE